ncbi:MAG: hypothetical protein JWM31_1571, partial [Solirubrobacterales bacterium]|nr:hypothetical protein [Solirubrobacterales bacterium]
MSPAGEPGLVGLGDSITNGEGAHAFGVPCRSWVEWLARTVDRPVHNLAVDGAVCAEIAARQLPRMRGRYA